MSAVYLHWYVSQVMNRTDMSTKRVMSCSHYRVITGLSCQEAEGRVVELQATRLPSCQAFESVTPLDYFKETSGRFLMKLADLHNVCGKNPPKTSKRPNPDNLNRASSNFQWRQQNWYFEREAGTSPVTKMRLFWWEAANQQLCFCQQNWVFLKRPWDTSSFVCDNTNRT